MTYEISWRHRTSSNPNRPAEPGRTELPILVGFINEIVEPEALMPRVLELAARIAKNAPLAVQAVKEAAIRTNGLPLNEAFAIEHECSAKVMTSSDAREGPRAFAEKREPVFTGE